MEELEVYVVDVHNDEILDAAIVYKTDGTYPTEASKDKKRAIRKRSERLEVDKGELFLLRKNVRVKIIIDPAEQKPRGPTQFRITSMNCGILRNHVRNLGISWNLQESLKQFQL